MIFWLCETTILDPVHTMQETSENVTTGITSHYGFVFLGRKLIQGNDMFILV